MREDVLREKMLSCGNYILHRQDGILSVGLKKDGEYTEVEDWELINLLKEIFKANITSAFYECGFVYLIIEEE